MAKKKKIYDLEKDADKAVAEYFTEKKNKLATSDERKTAIQHYLNSLVPDLLTMTDQQLRSFKRRTLFLIEEILGTTPLESLRGPCPPSLSTALSADGSFQSSLTGSQTQPTFNREMLTPQPRLF